MVSHETSPLNREPNRLLIHWQDWLSILLSIWLFVSPWILNFGGAVDTNIANTIAPTAIMAAWNAWVVGAVVLALCLRMLINERPTPRAIVSVLGVWIFFAPWVLGFMRLPAADWDHWITGALVAGLWFWHPAKRLPQS